jgi:hypothetical protein
MTIQEVSDAMCELERIIAEALSDFETRTNCRVEHIGFDRVFFHGAPTKYLVNTEVRL